MAVEGNSSSPVPSPGDLHTRIGLLVALLVISAVCSLLPVLCDRLRRMKKRRTAEEHTTEKPWKNVVQSFFNCFAGGVFLGVTFLHLLPDITGDWEKIFRESWSTSYPFDKFLVVMGFFIVLVIEQMAYTCQHCRPKKRTKRVILTPPPSPIRIQPNIVASLTIDSEVTPLLQGGEGSAANCKQCKQEHARHAHVEVAGDSNGEPGRSRSLLRRASAQYSSPDSVHVNGYNAKEEGDIEGEGGEGNDKGAKQGGEGKDKATSPGGLRAVFLGLALSVHSVFEGLAFGLIQSETDVGACTLLMCTNTCLSYVYKLHTHI